jgi:uncharacterized RDD family membrane protein YckC
METHNPYIPPRAQLVAEEHTTSEPLRPAGFWRRFFSLFLDAILILPLFFVLYFLFGKTHWFQLIYMLPSAAVGLLLNVYMVQRFGGSPAKLLLGMRIVHKDGSRVSTRSAVSRYSVMFILTSLTSLVMAIGALSIPENVFSTLGYVEQARLTAQASSTWFMTLNWTSQAWLLAGMITMLSNHRRRAVHDYLAGTVVVR